MELKGRVVVGDLLAAQWVHVRPRRSLAVVGMVLLGLTVFVMAAQFIAHRPSLTDPGTWIMPGILAYFAFTAFVWVPGRVRRSYSQRKDFQHEISMVVTSAGIEARTVQGYGVKPWSDFLKWKEGKSVFLLYLSDHMYQVVPKRFFAGRADIDAFRNVISESIGAK